MDSKLMWPPLHIISSLQPATSKQPGEYGFMSVFPLSKNKRTDTHHVAAFAYSQVIIAAHAP